MMIEGNSKPRILVIGAGAVGAYIGGSLSLSGTPVVFLSNPNSAQHLQQHGLRLIFQNRVVHLSNLEVCTSIGEANRLGQFDLAFFCIKSYDTRKALDDLKPFRDIFPPLVCLQNGVENEGILAADLGNDKVIAGTVTSAISKAKTGEVVLERLRGVGIAANHPLSTKVCDILNAAGLNAKLISNPDQMKWSKLLTNLLANATSAILDMTPADIYAHPRLFKIETAQIQEALTVMDTNDIKVVNLPGTPVRTLELVIKWLPEAFSRRILHLALGRGRGAKMPSLHIDLHSGNKRSEVNFLNGAVVRAGESSGVPTPINAALTQTLSDLVKGQLSIASFQHNPEKFLTYIQTVPAKRPGQCLP